MRLSGILAGVTYELLQGGDVDVKHIDIDSRKVRKGSMFFCIRGLKADARMFIGDAVKQGAVAVLIDDTKGITLPPDITVVKAYDARAAMALAAANICGNPSKWLKTIGVTGTNGKTSVTYFMESILNAHNAKTGVIGTVGVMLDGEKLHIPFDTSTTPDPIELQQIFKRMVEGRADYVVMEVSSHALELHKLDGHQFDVGIFTNLTQDHLDFHGSMNNYMLAKAKLFKQCKVAVINRDDPAGGVMVRGSRCHTVTYSINNSATYRAVNIKYLSTGVDFDLLYRNQLTPISIPVAGRFSVYNALSAIAAATELGLPLDTIKAGLKYMKGVPGRIQSVPNTFGFNVIIDYAHTPDGMTNILTAVREFTRGRIITVFGCGGDRDRTKRSVMGSIAGKMSDYCIITSDNPRTEEPISIIEEIEPGTNATGCLYEKLVDRRQAIFRAVELAHIGDSVVIAGKGHENYQIFADRTIHFDDYETAQAAIAGLGGQPEA